MKSNFTPMAKWIGVHEDWYGYFLGKMMPAYELRKTFTLEDEPKEAECLILGLGYYTLYINGKKVGDDVLSPAFTAYDKRSLFLRYDVSDFLQKGENCIAVKLGNGFYSQGSRNSWRMEYASWRNNPRLLFELFADGKTLVESNTSWKVRSDSATYHTSIRTGEYYDARKEDGWKNCEYCDTGWEFASIVNPPGGIICEMKMPPARECEVIPAQKMWKSAKGWIYDFGKNISGYVSLSASAKEGTTLTLTNAEHVKDGELEDNDFQRYVGEEYPYGTDKYIFCGKGKEEWKPEFVYHGFRYVEFVWDSDTEPSIDALTAYFVHTDLTKKGDFSCSDELFAWIYDAGVRSFLSNYQGLPLDCPHREKNGWTGDAAISADYAVFLYDMKEAYTKWFNDMADAQRACGQLPGIIPTAGWGYNWGAGPAWDIALFTLPYLLYKENGDIDALALTYDNALRYLEYAETKEDDDGLVCYGLSDWCPPTEYGELNLMPNRLSDSCYYYRMLKITEENARINGDARRACEIAKKAEQLRSDIKRVYIDNYDITSHGQGALAAFLYFDIVSGTEAKEIARMLNDLVIKDGYVHKVGILGMKALPNALSKYGYTDTAFKCLHRYEYPSYGYWKNIGETTLCEAWETRQSRNHHMYSDVVNWSIRNIAGLQNEGVAYDKVLFKPYLFDENCSASAKTKTPRGEISISWQRAGDEFIADIKVPDGCEARLELGESVNAPIRSGIYKFNLK